MSDSGGSTRDRGRAAEQAAADHLVACGLQIIERNYTGAGAELDLVARSDGAPPTYVFVEVRSRSSRDHGSPLETVDRRKQRRVVRAATAWLVDNELWEQVEARFDVMAVELGPDARPTGAIDWVRDAFDAS